MSGPSMHVHTHKSTHTHKYNTMYTEAPLEDTLPPGSLLGDNMHMS